MTHLNTVYEHAYVEGVNSQPRFMAKIAVTDGMAQDAVSRLRDAGHEVDLEPESLDGFEAVVIRSATKMTAEAIANAPTLRVIGRAGVGVDNIDLDAATNAGILVCNTPGSSTQSVVELTIGHLLASTRHIPTADRDLRSGNWTKKALKGTELCGKRIGFIGFGRIAQGVAKVAKTLPKAKGRLAPLPDIGTVRRWSSTLAPRHASGGTGLCSGIIPAALETSTPTLAHDHLI